MQHLLEVRINEALEFKSQTLAHIFIRYCVAERGLKIPSPSLMCRSVIRGTIAALVQTVALLARSLHHLVNGFGLIYPSIAEMISGII